MRPEEEEVVTLEDLDTKDLINEEQKNAKNLVCLRCPSKILPKNMGAYQTDTEKSLHVMHKKQAQWTKFENSIRKLFRETTYEFIRLFHQFVTTNVKFEQVK